MSFRHCCGLVFALICLFLPLVFIDNQWLWDLAPKLGPVIDRVVKALGAISGFVAVLGGKSASLKLDISNAAPKSNLTKAYELAIRLATLFFIAFLFMVLAYLERMTAEKLVSTAEQHGDSEQHRHFYHSAHSCLPDRLRAHLRPLVFLLPRDARPPGCRVVAGPYSARFGFFADSIALWVIDPAHSASMKVLMAQGFIAAGLFLIITVASMKIDVNRFSMHGVYRNRLVRAFLGGARAGRKADPFTDFDPADNCRVSELKAQKNNRRVLYPVINVTLNLVGGENLAWQERKASSFIITPFYCGSARAGRRIGDDVPGHAATNNPRKWTGAYVKTKDYGEQGARS